MAGGRRRAEPHAVFAAVPQRRMVVQAQFNEGAGRSLARPSRSRRSPPESRTSRIAGTQPSVSVTSDWPSSAATVAPCCLRASLRTFLPSSSGARASTGCGRRHGHFRGGPDRQLAPPSVSAGPRSPRSHRAATHGVSRRDSLSGLEKGTQSTRSSSTRSFAFRPCSGGRLGWHHEQHRRADPNPSRHRPPQCRRAVLARLLPFGARQDRI